MRLAQYSAGSSRSAKRGLARIVGRQRVPEHGRVAEHCREFVVEIVRHAPGQTPERLKPARSHQLFLKTAIASSRRPCTTRKFTRTASMIASPVMALARLSRVAPFAASPSSSQRHACFQ